MKIIMFNNIISQNENLTLLDDNNSATETTVSAYTTYQQLFQGRTDKIGVGNASVSVTNKQQITKYIKEHLVGNTRIGFYNLLPDGTCPWAVVEFENHDKAGDLTDPISTSLQFLQHMRSVGIPAYRELSKNPNGKCIHAWIFFETPISAKKVHLALNGFMHQVMGIYTEVFPKGYDTNKIGNFIRLPLFGAAEDLLGWGVPKERTVFIDEEGKPYPNQEAFPSSIKKVSEAQLDELIKRYKLPMAEANNNHAIQLTEGLDQVRNECSFMKHCEEHAFELPEPLWYAWITNAARFIGGKEYIHAYSKKYSGYCAIETDRKIAHALADTGPMTHEAIAKLGYKCDCPTKYRSPLSRATYIDITKEVARIKLLPDGDNKIQEIRKLISYWKNQLDTLEQSVYQEFIKKELGLKSAAFTVEIGQFTSQEIDYTIDLRSLLATCRELDKSYEECGEVIYNWMLKHSIRFYKDREHIYYLFAERRLLTINKNDPQFESYFFGLTGTTTATKDGEVYVKVLQALAERDGRMISMDTWLHTDLTRGTIYFNLNNDRQELVKISVSGVNIIENGSNDEEIMLRESEKILPINYVPMQDDATYKHGLGVIKSLVVDNLACKETDRVFCISWVIAGFFVEYVRTTPSLRLESDGTSGKSTGMELLSYPLYGSDVKKIGTTASNYTDAAINPLVLLDNVEAAEMNEGLKNFIITAVTGITKEKRKIGTDRGLVLEKTKCLICSTGIENWSIPEVINRTYVVEFDKDQYGSGFVDSVFLQIAKDRDLILSAEFQLISRILEKIESGVWRSYEETLGKRYPGHTTSRANAFLALMILIAEELLAAWEQKQEIWILVDAWIKTQNKIADGTRTDSNPILQYLNILKKEAIKYQELESKNHNSTSLHAEKYVWQFDVELVMSDPAGDQLTFTGFAKDFHTTFSKLCQMRGIQYIYKNARQLSKRIKDSRKQLEEAGWTFEDAGTEYREGKFYTLKSKKHN